MATKTKSKLKKSSTKKSTQPKEYNAPEFDSFVEPNPATAWQSNEEMLAPKKRPQFFKIALVVLVIAALGALVLRNRSWFIAATVNGMPIPRWELNDRLTKRFGNQVLEAIIGEKLITDAANNAQVSVSSEELQMRISEIEKSLDGQMKLEDALKLQGVTRDEFENQVKVQLLIDKMMAKEVSVSAAEVDDFMKNSGTMLSASDPAERRNQAEEAVKSNKIADKFQEWFTKLKEAAKINRYL